MLVARIGCPKGDDLRILRAIDRQAGAGRQPQRPGVLMAVDAGGRYRQFGIDPVDEEGGQQPRDPRQPDRRQARRRARHRRGTERPLERGREVELRVRQRDRSAEIEPWRRFDHHRGIGVGGGDLVGQLQRRGAAVGYQQRKPAGRERRQPERIGGLDREQGQGSLAGGMDRDRPAAPQRVDRARDVPGRVQKANSVMIGTWSDGLSQLRQSSNTLWLTACAATSPVAHIWSSRRPRSFLVQSGER